MSLLHHILGGTLILMYFITFILALFNEGISKKFRRIADIILFFQYIVGIILLINGERNVNLHYILALLPIILIPFSKMLGNKLTSFLIFIIIFLAYIVGIKKGL
ncbi:MAG: hypothetical protein ABIL49_03220 [candidate division WOR-3 bacterium]